MRMYFAKTGKTVTVFHTIRFINPNEKVQDSCVRIYSVGIPELVQKVKKLIIGPELVNIFCKAYLNRIKKDYILAIK